jgi:hypothetical protein
MINETAIIEQVNHALRPYASQQDQVDAALAIMITCMHFMRLQIGDDLTGAALVEMAELLDEPNPFSLSDPSKLN